MDVFVGNLAETVTAADLMRLLLPFDRQVQVKLEQQQYKGGAPVKYGVCTFSSERLAHKALKKLNGSPLLGRELSVREYLYRSYSNERRALGWRSRPWDGLERRGGERRSGTVLVAAADIFDVEEVATEEERIVIEGYSNFATKQT